MKGLKVGYYRYSGKFKEKERSKEGLTPSIGVVGSGVKPAGNLRNSEVLCRKGDILRVDSTDWIPR